MKVQESAHEKSVVIIIQEYKTINFFNKQRITSKCSEDSVHYLNGTKKIRGAMVRRPKKGLMHRTSNLIISFKPQLHGRFLAHIF